MAKELNFGTDPISCHAWDKNRQSIAISPNNHEVHIRSHDQSSGQWPVVATLSEHIQRVSGIDWAPETNRIVTCGADRNAYVWNLQPDGKWAPTLVILRINRAATCVKWSPEENKFAVGSGARIVSICYFDRENDWWVSKHIKKPIRSTVTCLDWHPNNTLLACGASDFKARIFSAYIKEIEQKPQSTSWGVNKPFGGLITDLSSRGGGWVHCIRFNAFYGDRLVWVGHDSTISVAESLNGVGVITVRMDFLPFTSCLWLDEYYILAGGHDCTPVVYKYQPGDEHQPSVLKFFKRLEITRKAASSKFSAMKHFQNLSMKDTSEDEVGVQTLHKNSILYMTIYSPKRISDVHHDQISTSGADGQVVIWETSPAVLEADLDGVEME